MPLKLYLDFTKLQRPENSGNDGKQGSVTERISYVRRKPDKFAQSARLPEMKRKDPLLSGVRMDKQDSVHKIDIFPQLSWASDMSEDNNLTRSRPNSGESKFDNASYFTDTMDGSTIGMRCSYDPYQDFSPSNRDKLTSPSICSVELVVPPNIQKSPIVYTHKALSSNSNIVKRYHANKEKLQFINDIYAGRSIMDKKPKKPPVPTENSVRQFASMASNELKSDSISIATQIVTEPTIPPETKQRSPNAIKRQEHMKMSPRVYIPSIAIENKGVTSAEGSLDIALDCNAIDPSLHLFNDKMEQQELFSRYLESNGTMMNRNLLPNFTSSSTSRHSNQRTLSSEYSYPRSTSNNSNSKQASQRDVTTQSILSSNIVNSFYFTDSLYDDEGTIGTIKTNQSKHNKQKTANVTHNVAFLIGDTITTTNHVAYHHPTVDVSTSDVPMLGIGPKNTNIKKVILLPNQRFLRNKHREYKISPHSYRLPMNHTESNDNSAIKSYESIVVERENETKDGHDKIIDDY